MNDIALDIFKFHSKNECERNQLICRNWNKIVKAHVNILPKREINCLFFKWNNLEAWYGDIEVVSL